MMKPTMIGEKLLSLLWIILLIVASAVPVVAIIIIWYQNSFEVPMPNAVLDSVTANPLVFSAFIVLIVVSFVVQYFFGSPATRKHEIRLRAPILIFISPIVIFIISVLVWWKRGSPFTTIVSEIVQKPFVLGSWVGLIFGSLILAFVMSTREEQKQCFKVLITLASVFFMFGGPTYLTYGLRTVNVPYSFATLIGLVSFLAGIAIFLRFVVRGTKT